MEKRDRIGIEEIDRLYNLYISNSINLSKYYKEIDRIDNQIKDYRSAQEKLGIIKREKHKLSRLFSECLLQEQRLAKIIQKIDNIITNDKDATTNNKDKIRELEAFYMEEHRQIEEGEVRFKKAVNIEQEKLIEILNIQLKEQENEIKKLENKNELVLKEKEDAILTKEIEYKSKLKDVKNKMTKDLEAIQDNVKSLNVQYMDDSNKLTILQNHQLVIQIEYQAQKIEELEKSKEKLAQRIGEYKHELSMHDLIEKDLLNKIKLLQSDPNAFSKTSKKEERIKEFLVNNKVTRDKDNSMNYVFSLERKIHNLEKKLKDKEKEVENQKSEAQRLQYRLNDYEIKYGGLFNFLENALNNFSNDSEIINNKDIYVNIDKIKQCDFTIFTSDEKYSLLVLMMKYLLPLVSLNMNNSCNIGNSIFQTNLNIINRKFNTTQRFMRDPDLKKAFLMKNNKIDPFLYKRCTANRFSNSIPVLRKNLSDMDPKLSSKF